jgi:hypothetical protein
MRGPACPEGGAPGSLAMTEISSKLQPLEVTACPRKFLVADYLLSDITQISSPQVMARDCNP